MASVPGQNGVKGRTTVSPEGENCINNGYTTKQTGKIIAMAHGCFLLLVYKWVSHRHGRYAQKSHGT